MPQRAGSDRAAQRGWIEESIPAGRPTTLAVEYVHDPVQRRRGAVDVFKALPDFGCVPNQVLGDFFDQQEYGSRSDIAFDGKRLPLTPTHIGRLSDAADVERYAWIEIRYRAGRYQVIEGRQTCRPVPAI